VPAAPDRITLIAAILREGTLAAAARRLGVGKAGLSKRLAAIERDLGMPLFMRTPRGLHPAEAARPFLETVARLVDELAEAEERLRSGSGTPRGRVRVNAALDFGRRHLVPLLPAFFALYPGVEVELDLEDRYADLLREEVDVAVRIGRFVDSALRTRQLGTSRLFLVAAPELLARLPPLRAPEDLAAAPCLRYRYGRSPDVWAFTREGRTAQVRVRGPLLANNGEAIAAAARAGLGIARLPDFLVEEDLAAGRLVRLLPEWDGDRLDICAVFTRERGARPAVRAFLDFLAARLGPRRASTPAQSTAVEQSWRSRSSGPASSAPPAPSSSPATAIGSP